MSEQNVQANIRDELARSVTKGYRTTLADALPLADEILARSPALQDATKQARDVHAVTRQRVYKDAVREAKRLAYKRLRMYKTDAEELEALTSTLQALPPDVRRSELRNITHQIAGLHVSTRERLSCLTEFNNHVTDILAESRTILDVGCGVYPLLFPFAVGSPVERYVGADSDATCIRTLRAFAKHVPALLPLEWRLNAGWDTLTDALGTPAFDVALLFKVVPVITRQKRELLPVLARTPARRWIVTGSTVSMTKRRSIARRERATLLRFITDAGRTVESECTIGEELVLVVSDS